MITFRDFSAIFKDTDFSHQELRKFYYSVKKSVILRFLGKKGWSEIFKIEEDCQWPVLSRIGDPTLSIYKGADKKLLEKFIGTISEEKELRSRRYSLDKVRYWTSLQHIIDERIELFTQIFDFCGKDVRHCGRVAERYGRMVEKRIQHRKKMWKIGIGTGAATLAGAAALWYVSKKEKD